jgi:hypothetical protein
MEIQNALYGQKADVSLSEQVALGITVLGLDTRLGLSVGKHKVSRKGQNLWD